MGRKRRRSTARTQAIVRPRQQAVQQQEMVQPQRQAAPSAHEPELVERQNAGVMVSQQVLVQKYFAGPLPSPEVLGEYEAAFPGLADRIVKMAEDRHEMAKAQSEHRQRMEASVVAANIVSERLGSIFAFILALAFLGGAVVAALNQHDTVAAVLGGATVVSLAATFIAGRWLNSAELKQKRDASQSAPPKR